MPFPSTRDDIATPAATLKATPVDAPTRPRVVWPGAIVAAFRLDYRRKRRPPSITPRRLCAEIAM